MMGFDRLDELRLERSLVDGGAKSAVAHVPAGPAGNLGDLGSVQPAGATPIEFAGAGEGDMVEIHVQPHPDRVGGDEIVDLASLEHADLGIARSRAQRSHDDGRAAPLAADELGEREYIS